MEGIKDQLGYPENLFETYVAHAAGTEISATPPDASELIRGLERLDLAGYGGDFVAREVLDETTVVYNALMAKCVPTATLVVFPDNVVSPHRNSLASGWSVTTLQRAPSKSGEGKITHEDNPRVLLSQEGGLYVYWPALEKPADDPVDGIVFNRYAPVCSTRMNDRSILYGFARLVSQHELDISSEPAAA